MALDDIALRVHGKEFIASSSTRTYTYLHQQKLKPKGLPNDCKYDQFEVVFHHSTRPNPHVTTKFICFD